MRGCIAGHDGVYCQHLDTVDVSPDDEHMIVERSDESLSCAWCRKHNCPCKDMGYYCSDMIAVKGHYDEDMNWIEERV